MNEDNNFISEPAIVIRSNSGVQSNLNTEAVPPEK